MAKPVPGAGFFFRPAAVQKSAPTSAPSAGSKIPYPELEEVLGDLDDKLHRCLTTETKCSAYEVAFYAALIQQVIQDKMGR